MLLLTMCAARGGGGGPSAADNTKAVSAGGSPLSVMCDVKRSEKSRGYAEYINGALRLRMYGMAASGAMAAVPFRTASLPSAYQGIRRKVLQLYARSRTGA